MTHDEKMLTARTVEALERIATAVEAIQESLRRDELTDEQVGEIAAMMGRLTRTPDLDS